jgi:hypothetical protein
MHLFHGLCLRIVAAVTERFVLRFSTTAKSNSVTHAIIFVVFFGGVFAFVFCGCMA